MTHTTRINLVPFIEESIEIIKSLSLNDMYNLFETRRTPHEEILTKINFDPKKPEYHNVYVTDLRNGRAIYYNGEEWITDRFYPIADKLVYSKKNDLEVILTIMKKFPNADLKRISEAEKKMNSINLSLDRVRKDIESSFRCIMYNNRVMIKRTRLIVENQPEEYETIPIMNLNAEYDINQPNFPTYDELMELHNKELIQEKIIKNLLQEQCIYVLEILTSTGFVNIIDKKKIENRIKNTHNTSALLVLIRILCKYLIRTDIISDINISEALETEKQINSHVTNKKQINSQIINKQLRAENW